MKFYGLDFLSVNEGKTHPMVSLGGFQEGISAKHVSIQEDHGEPGNPGRTPQVWFPSLLFSNLP